MNQISLLKSTAFRITLIYVLLFGLSVSIILGFVYWSTIIYETNQTEENINAEIRALSEVYRTKGIPGLVTTLSERIEQQRPGDPSLYILADNQYQPLVHNISAWPQKSHVKKGDWLVFNLDVDNKQFSARAREIPVENRYNLLIGRSMRDLDTLNALVSKALVWGLMLTLILGLFGGFMMRQILSSRLASINQTSREIMHGDLRKRIHTRGTEDEFDELANNLNSMLDQIEHGMEGVRRVSDNIAHDLKTPLARLKNKVEELRLSVSGNVSQETKLDQIIGEADGLLATFNALLRIARIEYSEQRESFREVDINSILYDLQELYEPVIEERGQSLQVRINSPMIISADRDMLFQAFANLLDNAIKYTPEGGDIEIRSYRQGKLSHIEINDNGPGIPESEYEKVTQRFYRIDPSRTTPGSGLGLSLVFAVLKLHKLDLHFSDNNPGLKVRVTMKSSGPNRSKRKQDKHSIDMNSTTLIDYQA